MDGRRRHPPQRHLASPEELAEARALRDSLRCLAAHQTDDTRPAAVSRADLAWSVDVLNAAAARLPAAQLRIENNTFRRATPNPTVPAALAGVATEAVDLFGGTSADELRACQAPAASSTSSRLTPAANGALSPAATEHAPHATTTEDDRSRRNQNELTRARSLPRRNRSFSGEPGDVDHPTVAVARTRSHRKLGSEADSHRGSGLVPRRRAVTPVLDSLEQGARTCPASTDLRGRSAYGRPAFGWTGRWTLETGRMPLGWKLLIDSTNAPTLADFWAAALEYEVEDPSALISQLLAAGRIGSEAGR